MRKFVILLSNLLCMTLVFSGNRSDAQEANNTNNQVKVVLQGGHAHCVTSVAFSPDGELMATASEDHSICIWTRGGIQLRRLKGHARRVSSVAFSHDGQLILSCSWDNTVKLWNLNGECVKTIIDSDGVHHSVFSPDGKIIAIAGHKEIRLRDRNGTLLNTLKGHTGKVDCVVYSPDGQIMASSSIDGTIRLWDNSGRCLRTMSVLENRGLEPLSVAFSPDGSTIATGSCHNLWLWSLDGRLLYQYSGKRGGTYGNYSIVYSPDGKTIAMNSSGSLILLDVASKAVREFKNHINSSNYGVAFSSDGEIIALGVGSSIERRSRNGKLLSILSGKTNPVSCTAFNHDGKMLASVHSYPAKMILWDRNGSIISEIDLRDNMGRGTARAVIFSPDGKYFALGDDAVAFSPNGKIIATGDTQARLIRRDGAGMQIINNREKQYGTICLFDMNGGLIRKISAHRASIQSLSFSKDGQFIASSSLDGTGKLWKVDGTLVKTFIGKQAYMSLIAISPFESMIAYTGGTGELSIFNQKGELQFALPEYTNNYGNNIAFSPDGNMVACGRENGIVRVYDKKGALLHRFFGHSGVVTSVNFSRDGKYLTSGSYDGTIWSLKLNIYHHD